MHRGKVFFFFFPHTLRSLPPSRPAKRSAARAGERANAARGGSMAAADSWRQHGAGMPAAAGGAGAEGVEGLEMAACAMA